MPQKYHFASVMGPASIASSARRGQLQADARLCTGLEHTRQLSVRVHILTSGGSHAIKSVLEHWENPFSSHDSELGATAT